MKKLLAILAVIVLITACSPQSGGENIAIDASKSDITKTYQAAGNDTITLNGLKPGSIYTIYPESASNTVPKGSQSFVKSTTNTIIFIPDAETETFRAGDLGIDEEAFRIIEQLPAGGDMIINTSTDKPLFTNSKGQKVYEKYFEIPVSNLSDPANTVIFDYMTGSSSNTSSDYGIIVDGKKTRSAGIMDFSEEESIIVYIQCHYGTLNSPSCTYGAKVDTPKSIGTGNLEAPNAYRIEKADDELILELEINSSEMRDFSALTRYPWPRSAESGMITGNMVPMKYENGKLFFYIGKISEDILVNILSEKGEATIGSAVVRPIKSDEKSLIQEWDIAKSDTFQINIPEFLINSPQFLKEGCTVDILVHAETEEPLSCELPAYMDFEITYTEPGEKGNTATNAMKDATIDTGATIRVPLFVNTGDKVRVDTRSGEYSQRV